MRGLLSIDKAVTQPSIFGVKPKENPNKVATLPYSKIYNKRDDFDIINCTFLYDGVPPSTSYRVFFSQIIQFAEASCC